VEILIGILSSLTALFIGTLFYLVGDLRRRMRTREAGAASTDERLEAHDGRILAAAGQANAALADGQALRLKVQTIDARIGQHDTAISANDARITTLGVAYAHGARAPTWAAVLAAAEAPPLDAEGDRGADPGEYVPPSSAGAIRQRVEAEEDERRARLDAAKRDAGDVAEDARRTVEIPKAKLPSADVEEDDGDRETPEEGTRLYERSAVPLAPKGPVPHAPPRPIKSKRPRLLDGLAGASERHPVEGPTLISGIVPPAVPLNFRTAHRIDVLFWSKLSLAAQDGVQTAHCEGPGCDPSKATCDCNCNPCDRRRTLYERATIEILGPQTAAELARRARMQRPGVAARVERRWHELVAAAQEAGKDARHCHGKACMTEGEEIDRCACACAGCVLVLDLLVQAEGEIIGGGE
jgi:hypothetical protein